MEAEMEWNEQNRRVLYGFQCKGAMENQSATTVRREIELAVFPPLSSEFATFTSRLIAEEYHDGTLSSTTWKH
jgi:hypothetical protein